MPHNTETALRAELAETKRALDQTRLELAKTRDELSAVYASRSWRITKPLRLIIKKIRDWGAESYVKKYDDLFTRASKSAPLVTVPSVPHEEEHIPLGDGCDVSLLAYYLPQFHAFPENDVWWGKDFTEWSNVRRSKPFFPGHVQPPIPHASVGYYDLGENAAETLRLQINMAKRHGVAGFCFHHYWFSGKRLMEKPVDALLRATDIDLPFCLNWANENWTRRWDGLENDVLIAQKHSAEDDLAFIRDALRYFSDSRHIRVNGRPMLLVYHAALLPNMVATLDRWRETCVQEGEAEPYCVMVQSFTNIDPREHGFDATAQFPPHAAQTPVRLESVHNDFKGDLFSYDNVVASSMARWTTEYRIFPGAMPAWDNTPRRMERGRIFIGSTPEKYEDWLRAACAFARAHLPPEERFVFINSWNEWAEGAQLEPSAAHGFAYLNATSRAVRT